MELPSPGPTDPHAAGFSRYGSHDDAAETIHSERLLAAMQLLVRAFNYARDSGRDAWDFAVELPHLRHTGLTLSDFRWLVCKGYVEHRREVTAPDEGVGRSFQTGNLLKFTKQSCFVITPAGMDFARSLSQRTAGARESQGGVRRPEQLPETGRAIRTDDPAGQHIKELKIAPPPVPEWDYDYRQVRVGDRIVKQFKLPSPNQEAILIAFQEEGWPPRIDDPLPPHPDCDPKQRLHDTIRSLNRNQKNRLLRFKGDGTGQGILWELIDPSRPD